MTEKIEPVAHVSRGTKRAHVLWIGDNEKRIPHGTKLYAGPGPHSPAEIEAVELTRCCGRSECGGECGNAWTGTEWVAVRRDQQQLDALIAERDALQDGNETLLDHIGDLVSRLQRAEARAAANRADAERWRFCGEHSTFPVRDQSGEQWVMFVAVKSNRRSLFIGDTQTEAIDAARATTTRAAEGR